VHCITVETGHYLSVDIALPLCVSTKPRFGWLSSDLPSRGLVSLMTFTVIKVPLSWNAKTVLALREYVVAALLCELILFMRAAILPVDTRANSSMHLSRYCGPDYMDLGTQMSIRR
jgi:hypothetical protein